MALKGDFAKLDQWARRINKLADSATVTALSKNLAEEALNLVAEGFATQTDPYGQAWRAKKHSDGRAILVGRTARLRRGWKRKAFGPSGFRIGPSVPYAGFHQSGTRYMVARRMVPTKDMLPSRWRRALSQVAVDFIRRQLSR
jgi:phage gpG-like protein